jgi:hypothetical protein
MGYCSEVALAFSAEMEKEFLKKLKKQNPEVQRGIDGADFYTKDGCTLRVWQMVKWYTDFPEVQFIEDFINSLDDDGDEAVAEQYRFLRIGENLDDIEDRGCLCPSFTLYITTKIVTDVNEGKALAPQPENTPATPPSDLLQVSRHLELSLSHIPFDDYDKLDREVEYQGEVVVYRKDRGYFIFVPQDNVEEYLNLLFERGISDAFRHIVRVASGLGCDWIVADVDAKIAANLPVFG